MARTSTCTTAPALRRGGRRVFPRAALLAALLGAACRSAPPPTPEPHVHPSPGTGETLDASALVADLRATILESYRWLAGGYDDAYLDGVAHDARVVLLDVKPKDVVVGYEPRAATMRRHFPEHRLDIVARTLSIHLAGDRTAAWTFDDVSYRVSRRGRWATIPLRVSAVYERRDGRWLKVLEHTSYGVRDDEALAAAAAGRIVAPEPLVDDLPPGPVAAEVYRVVLGLIEGADGAASSLASVSEEALYVGSDPEREVRGAAIAELAAVGAVYGRGARVRPAGLRVHVAPSGALAWAAAHLVVVVPREGGEVNLPLRATWVLERQGDAFRVVQTHLSVPVTRDQLAETVFGEPLEPTEATAGTRGTAAEAPPTP